MAMDEATPKLSEFAARLSRDIELLVRLQLSSQASAGNKTQSDMIRELKTMGLSSGDIARYLGTTVKQVATIAARKVKVSGKIKRGGR